MMNLINAHDLSASGIAYTIIDDDALFDADGELTGYTEVIDETYQAFDGSGESESLVDVDELRDDYTGRWEHLRDAHFSEMLLTEQHSRPMSGDQTLDYGAMQFWALHRERKVVALVHYMTCLALQLRGERRTFVRRRAELLRDGISRRRAASIRLILARGQNEWWLLYLTSAQYTYLMRCVRRLLVVVK
jgi:hypothetical protein